VKAIQIAAFGPPEELRPVDLPDPEPGDGEVLISLRAVGVNRQDLLIRSGAYHRAGRPPLVLGAEGAGHVTAIGPAVRGLSVGERVIAMNPGVRPGFYAELVAASAIRVVQVPDGVDLHQAAALPTAWLSAWYCLRRLADVQAGETVLILAAASGVGSAAVQIARDAGADVIAAARGKDKADWARSQGATHGIDSSTDANTRNIADQVLTLTDGRGVDVVLDTVGGEALPMALKSVGHGGRVVTLANVALAPSTIDTRDFYPKNARILGFQITNLIERLGYDPRPDLNELLIALAQGRFRVPIDRTFALDRAADAHRYLEERRNRGKVLLTING
jgi:NADPH:quinone reductase